MIIINSKIYIYIYINKRTSDNAYVSRLLSASFNIYKHICGISTYIYSCNRTNKRTLTILLLLLLIIIIISATIVMIIITILIMIILKM